MDGDIGVCKMHSLKSNYPSLNALAPCASLSTALYRVLRLFVSMLYEVARCRFPAELTYTEYRIS